MYSVSQKTRVNTSVDSHTHCSDCIVNKSVDSYNHSLVSSYRLSAKTPRRKRIEKEWVYCLSLGLELDV